MAETATKVTIQSHDAEKDSEKRRGSEPVSEKEQTAELVSFEGILGDSVGELPIERHAALLSDPRLSHPANAAQKARIIAGLQRSYGNIYVQRLLKRVTEPSEPAEMEAEAVGQAAFNDRDIGVKTRAEMTGAIARDGPKGSEAPAPAAEGAEAQRKSAELAGRWRSALSGLNEGRAAARRGDYESAFAKCVDARVIATAFKGIPGFSEDARGLINLTEFGAEHAVGGLDALRTGGKSVSTALDGAVLAAGDLQNSLLSGAEPQAEGAEAQRKGAELAGRWRSAWFGLIEGRFAARRGDYDSAFAKCVEARAIATAFKGIPGFSQNARSLINLTEFGAEHAVGGLDALRTGGKSVFTALDGAVLAAGNLQNSLLTGAEPRTVPAPGGPK